MNKIIFSSSYFSKRFKGVLFSSDAFITVKVDKRKLSIEGVEIPIESRRDFEITVIGRALNNLITFCNKIEDQPITAAFDSYYNIDISSFIL